MVESPGLQNVLINLFISIPLTIDSGIPNNIEQERVKLIKDVINNHEITRNSRIYNMVVEAIEELSDDANRRMLVVMLSEKVLWVR